LFIEKTKLDQSRGEGLDPKDSATIIMQRIPIQNFSFFDFFRKD